MKWNDLRLTRFACTMLAALLALVSFSQVGHAQPANGNAKVKVKVLKPLVITKQQDLDFGIIAAPSLSGTVTVTISQGGVLSCPAPLTCSGTALPALYNIKGSNRAPVDIVVNGTDLVNPADSTTIALTLDAPSVVTLPNSGNKGTDFNVGGSIEIHDGASGVYEGTIEVIAEYQ